MPTVSQPRRPTSSPWEQRRPGGRWEGRRPRRRILIGCEWPWFKHLSSPWQTVLEVLKGRAIPISLWILIGSVIGGLLLLALIIFVLWKVLMESDSFRGGERELHRLINLSISLFSSAGIFCTQTDGRGREHRGVRPAVSSHDTWQEFRLMAGSEVTEVTEQQARQWTEHQ